MDKEMMYWCDFRLFKVGFNQLMENPLVGFNQLMGYPLAPILANLFMGYHDIDWIEKAHVTKPTFYKRYVDDIFSV